MSAADASPTPPIPPAPPAATAADTTLKGQESANINRIGELSDKIREAIRQALPTPQEQFLTVMVPGKVVDLDDFKLDKPNDTVLPLKTELNQAILCDDMPALSTLQMGPTGRSVARSYGEVISKLVPANSTIGVDADSMNPAQKRYDDGMKFLSKEVPGQPGKTVIDIYTAKQIAYTKTVENKSKAFDDALQRAKSHPANRTNELIRQAYDQWVAENARTYRNYIQAAYMDWVVSGKKEEVEYWFAVVDQDSAMAHVEKSKEAMRLAVIQDDDGSTEYQKVKLQPPDWSNKCLEKIRQGSNQTKTADWYAWEIARLEKVNAVLAALKKAPIPLGDDDKDEGEIKKQLAEAETKLSGAIADSIEKQRIYQIAAKNKDKSKEADAAYGEYIKAQGKVRTAQEEHDKIKVEQLAVSNRKAETKLYKEVAGDAQNEIGANEKIIGDYQLKLADLAGGGATKDDAVLKIGKDIGIPSAAPEPGSKPNPTNGSNQTPNPTPTTPARVDFFTPISVEISASSEAQKSSSSATSFSAGGSASWGLGHVSASVSHGEAHAAASKEVANSDVKISFECMRVDITRSWLQPQLFYDNDLMPGPGVMISPGFTRLSKLMEKPGSIPGGEAELMMYSTFPLYPTAFIVACNVVLEISGNTSSLQTYMNSSSTSASASVGYGPFSISASGAHSSSDAGSTCQSTASGCRIEIKSPQIIAWVSQMVPALPRVNSVKATDLVNN